MKTVSLQELLEAGAHFGHKKERWHPKAGEYIYTEKDGIHIFDLAKTKALLEKAAEYVENLVREGKEIVFVGTKRQAKGVIAQLAEDAGAPYFTDRWIGGFLTNWDAIKKNIEKINNMTREHEEGAWKSFPKHEQAKKLRHLQKLKRTYAGVLRLKEIPEALFIVDPRKESAAMFEAKRLGVTVVAIVDTNTDPTPIDYVIPANDDAVGSIKIVSEVIASAYADGKKKAEKEEKDEKAKANADKKEEAEKSE